MKKKGVGYCVKSTTCLGKWSTTCTCYEGYKGCEGYEKGCEGYESNEDYEGYGL